MKRLRIWIALPLVLALLCPLTVPSFAQEETAPVAAASQNGETKAVNEVVYAIAPVNIRSGPGTQHQIIGVLYKGKSIHRTGIRKDGWSEVIYQNRTAYIHTSYLTANPGKDAATGVDDQELLRQIAIGNGLNRMEYTAQSWESLTTAMEGAGLALDSRDQVQIDAAAQLLKDAIAGLTRMDYTALEAALTELQALGEKSLTSALWLELMEAGEKGRALLTSGDQPAVDAAAQQLQGLMLQLSQSASQPAPEVIIQEVPVEVPPSEDYCNISSHRIWQAAFFASVGLNVILGVLILVYISKKKRKHRDNTPLVNYNIFDDTV